MTAPSCRRLLLVATSWLVASATTFGAPLPVVECLVPGDTQARVYRVVDRGNDLNPRWLLTLTGKRLGPRAIELPLPEAIVDRTGGGFSIASRSANGGLAVTVRAFGADSLVDVFVNYELEVNVWRDLTPDVEHMNTDGPLAQARCRILSPPASLP